MVDSYTEVCRRQLSSAGEKSRPILVSYKEKDTTYVRAKAADSYMLPET